MRFSGRLGAGALVATSLPSEAVAQNSRDAFRRKKPYDLVFLPTITIKEPVRVTIPVEEQIKYLNTRFPITKGRNFKLIESYAVLSFAPEPDQEYAAGLIEEARKSIEHMVGFLGSAYIKKPELVFRIPKNEGDVRPQTSQEMLIFPVSRLEPVRVGIYEFEGLPGRFTDRTTLDTAGYFSGDWRLQPDYTITHPNWPIFYKTSSDIVRLVEAPAIEVLHKLTEPYAIQNLEERLRVLNPQPSERSNLTMKYVSENEKFVHALSILWLRKYNQDRNLGLTEQELTQRFLEYEKRDIYLGTNQLAQRISMMGVQKAIELYVRSPDALFKGIPN